MSYYLYCLQQGIPCQLDNLFEHTLAPLGFVMAGYPSAQTLAAQMAIQLDNYRFSPQTVTSQFQLPQGQEELPPVVDQIDENRGRRTRKQCVSKQLESAKKNSESNIVNQLLAFLNSPKLSETLVDSAIRKVGWPDPAHKKVTSIFYNVVRLMNFKRGRKYVNRASLLKYFTPRSVSKEFPQIRQKCEETGLITLQALCHLIRVVVFEFTRNYSITAVLTSKRISAVAKPDHLRRLRKVEKSLKNEDS